MKNIKHPQRSVLSLKIKIPFKTVAKTGVGYIDRGADITIGFRADMDALPVEEKTGLPLLLSIRVMHACGHDGHLRYCSCGADT